MTTPSVHESDFYVKHAGYQVGRRRMGAARLARAAAWGAEHGVTVEWEDSPELWDGDCPPPRFILDCIIRAPSGDIASLGMIGVDRMSDPCFDVVEAELCEELRTQWRERWRLLSRIRENSPTAEQGWPVPERIIDLVREGYVCFRSVGALTYRAELTEKGAEYVDTIG